MTEEGRLAHAAGADALIARLESVPFSRTAASLNDMAAARDFVVYNSFVNSFVFGRSSTISRS